MLKIGHGYDVHRLVENRKLILGGVEILYEKGLLGHSDADVLLHSIIDAILGALAMGDIGVLFPDTDDRYKDIDSVILLQKTADIMFDKGFAVGNMDSTIVAEKPKLSFYINKMRENIAKILKADLENISIKATTEEGLGLAGKGISATTVIILSK